MGRFLRIIGSSEKTIMSINFEVKGQLAKLLATEDLVVEHRHVETAMFNVHTRVLTLPMWKKATDRVFDMLVAHEVGHALFTPDEWNFKIPKQYVNVVEDVRIEKLIKRKYAGLSKTFYRGYEELAEEDFFCLENEDVNKMNLADKVNLYYKIGNFIDVQFSEEEIEIVDMINEAETFADALIAAEMLFNYCKNQQKSKVANIDEHDNQQSQSGDNSETVEDTDNQDNSTESKNHQSSAENTESEELNDSVDEEKNHSAEKISEDLEVKTMETLEDSISELIEYDKMDKYHETTYLEFPKLDMDNVIVKNKDIHDYCEDFWKPYVDNNDVECFRWPDTEYQKFKKFAQKEVNYLVKEFECRKSADSYARASTSRTGVLDCSKLHTYKYNEDLFKKVTTLADGKNHGLVFVLDWSGSMGKVMLDTIKQLYNLIWFCKKVSIPFEVYAFTGEWACITYDEDGYSHYPKPHYVKEENTLCVHESFNMMNIFTSKVNGKTLEKQLLNIFRIAFSFDRYCDYNNPPRLSLSGTPLNESLIALSKIIPDFQSSNKLQKVQCVILTDGEASPLNRHILIDSINSRKPYIGSARLHTNCYIRDRKLGSTYNVMNYGSCAHISFTNCLLEVLRDKFPNTNFIGVRVLDGRDSGSFIRLHIDSYEEVENVKSIWKKERSFVLKDCGYHKYFGLSGSDLSNDTEFEVDEDFSKAKIKTAFIKSLKSKKMNKKILNEFVNLIV